MTDHEAKPEIPMDVPTVREGRAGGCRFRLIVFPNGTRQWLDIVSEDDADEPSDE